MIHLNPVDILLIILYALAVLFVGMRASRKRQQGEEDYLLAGRTLTIPMFVATLVSTWYGGILGTGEFSYRYGILNWIVMGVPYYLFAFLFAMVLAKKIRATNFMTIPDNLEASYDRRTALLGGFLTFLLVTPAAYVLMLGVLVQLLTGLPLPLSMLLTTALTVCYLFAGGFRSGIWANALEFVLMFAGFGMILPFAYDHFGGFAFIAQHVPPSHLQWHGGHSWQYVAVWFFIALWTLVDPAFHQRCYAARDGKTAQRGILISILFWFCFDFLTNVAGLYARAALPDLAEPLFAYPLLAEKILPPVAKGLFYIGLLATIMSTLSSYMFISATTVGKDLAAKFSQKSSSPDAFIQRWTKIGLLLSSLFSILLALVVPSVVGIWYTIGTAIIPGLLVPVVASYFRPLKIPARYAFWAMLLGWIVSTMSLVYGQFNQLNGNPGYWLGVEPMYPGLFVALAVWSLGKLSNTTLSENQ